MSKRLIILGMGHANHALIRAILSKAYIQVHDIPIIEIKEDHTKELLLSEAVKDFTKACHEASFKLRTTSYERRNPNQPWYRKFDKKNKRK